MRIEGRVRMVIIIVLSSTSVLIENGYQSQQ